MTRGASSREQISINCNGPGMPSQPGACPPPAPRHPERPRHLAAQKYDGDVKKETRELLGWVPVCPPPRQTLAAGPREINTRGWGTEAEISTDLHTGRDISPGDGEGWGDGPPPSAPPKSHPRYGSQRLRVIPPSAAPRLPAKAQHQAKSAEINTPSSKASAVLRPRRSPTFRTQREYSQTYRSFFATIPRPATKN